MYLFQHFFPSLMTAALVCAVLLAPGLWLPRWRVFAPAIALAAGYFAGHVVAAGWPSFPAREAAQWLPWFACLAAVIGVLDRKFQPLGLLRFAGWLLVCAGLIVLLLTPGFQYHWAFGGGSLRIAAVVLAMLLISMALERGARVERAALNLSLILWIACSGTAVTLMMSGSAFLGQLAAVLAAAAVVILFFSIIFPAADLRTLHPLVTVMLSSLIVSGGFYAELPLASALLLLLALLSLALPAGALEGRWKLLVIRAGIACIASTLSVVMALRASPPFPKF